MQPRCTTTMHAVLAPSSPVKWDMRLSIPARRLQRGARGPVEQGIHLVSTYTPVNMPCHTEPPNSPKTGLVCLTAPRQRRTAAAPPNHDGQHNTHPTPASNCLLGGSWVLPSSYVDCDRMAGRAQTTRRPSTSRQQPPLP
jgi:hypothetical protein